MTALVQIMVSLQTHMCVTRPQWVKMHFWQVQSLDLTHWGRVTHICVGKLTIIGLDNGLSPGRRQAIVWTNAGILLFGPLASSFCEIVIEIDAFSFTKMHLKLSSAKWRPPCLGLNVLSNFLLGYQTKQSIISMSKANKLMNKFKNGTIMLKALLDLIDIEFYCTSFSINPWSAKLCRHCVYRCLSP